MANNLGNKETMAKNIKRYLIETGISQTEMAEKLNVPQSTFSYWMNAKTYPRIDKIEKMAEYFGVNKSDLIEEKSAPSEKDALIAEIAAVFSRLSPEKAKQVLAYAQFLAQQPEEP